MGGQFDLLLLEGRTPCLLAYTGNLIAAPGGATAARKPAVRPRGSLADTQMRFRVLWRCYFSACQACAKHAPGPGMHVKSGAEQASASCKGGLSCMRTPG